MKATGRRWIPVAAGVLVLAAVLAAAYWATRPRVARIGFLGMSSAMQATRVEALRQGLAARGYVEGRNVHIEYRWAEGRFDRLPALAEELVAAGVDVIVTAAPPAVRAAHHATTTIPIVVVMHDPVGMGMAKSLPAPGGNVTGIAFQDSSLSSKRLDLLRDVVPGLRRVAVVWNREGGGTETVAAVQTAAAALHIETLSLEIGTRDDFAPAIAEAKRWGAQAVLQLASPFITANRDVLMSLLAANRLPASCELRIYVVDGCLMTYSANLDDEFRMMAGFVDRILKGGNPATMAFEQPREFEFVINGRTAADLGVVVPESLVYQLSEPPLCKEVGATPCAGVATSPATTREAAVRH
ncbi:MAG: ABC transporter substrate-binding protein [Burkholderiales bacterium]